MKKFSFSLFFSVIFATLQIAQAITLDACRPRSKVVDTSGVPSNSICSDGDFAFDSATKTIYLKTSGSWDVGTVLGGNPFDQSLNTTDDISFANIYGNGGGLTNVSADYANSSLNTFFNNVGVGDIQTGGSIEANQIYSDSGFYGNGSGLTDLVDPIGVAIATGYLNGAIIEAISGQDANFGTVTAAIFYGNGASLLFGGETYSYYAVISDSGWTANASVGDKTQSVADYSGSGLNGTMTTALNTVSAGTGTALAQDEARIKELIKKVQALETALASAKRPNN